MFVKVVVTRVTALDQLRTSFTEARLEEDFQNFIIKSGVKSVLVFARVAATEEELLNRVVKPWLTSLEEDKGTSGSMLWDVVAKCSCVGGLGCSECHLDKEHDRGFQDFFKHNNTSSSSRATRSTAVVWHTYHFEAWCTG